MTRRRWIADESSGDRAALIGAHAEHLARVLRARVGQQFDVAVNGVVRRGTVSKIEDQRVEFTLGEELSVVPVANLTLALSIFKFDRMEWAIEKCTELGVGRFIPLVAQRTATHLATAAEKRVERWRRIAQQASEQSRRVAPPEVSAPLRLQQILDTTADLRIVLSEIEGSVSLKDAMDAYAPGQGITLAFGPEGGWTQQELDALQKAGWKSASLGRTILRAETAAIAATAVVVAEAQ
ncbi:MAG TPA: RsmE family RNA methyltransferase [Terriglobales bacterium]|nr:RsmE family RNA methyltransferase [Terriglobales bacterium]